MSTIEADQTKIEVNGEDIKTQGLVYLNPYWHCATEFQPNMFSKRVENNPNGGRSIFLVWNAEQAINFFYRTPSLDVPVLCVKESDMTIEYCYNAQSTQEFYDDHT